MPEPTALTEPRFQCPDGRSFWFPSVDLPAERCPTCHGTGHFDSCFDCGNRGYFRMEAPDA